MNKDPVRCFLTIHMLTRVFSQQMTTDTLGLFIAVYKPY